MGCGGNDLGGAMGVMFTTVIVVVVGNRVIEVHCTMIGTNHTTAIIATTVNIAITLHTAVVIVVIIMLNMGDF